MKLLECHIAGFGGFSNYRMTFNEGLNVIMQPNGWGKSTFVAFIKAMLYGFERKRVNDITENERLRYKPWGGGPYGGSLDFEHAGVSYRVTRRFGDKPADDVCKVVDLDAQKPVNDWGSSVGEWVFGLDANAFKKSVLVEQEDFGTEGSIASLRSRLNALVNEADDVAGLDKALGKLDERRKYYKKTGNRGHLFDVAHRMEQLVGKRKEREGQVDELASFAVKIADTDKSLADLQEQIAAVRVKEEEFKEGTRAFAALTRVRAQLLDSQRVAAKALADFDAEGDVPTEAALSTMSKALKAIGQFDDEARGANNGLLLVNKKRTSILEHYNNTVFTSDDVAQSRQKLADLKRRMREFDALANKMDASESKAHKAIEEHPDLPVQIGALLAKWSYIEKSTALLEEGRRVLAAKDAQWSEIRMRVESLQADARAAASAVPNDADAVVSSLRATGAFLRQCEQKEAVATSRKSFVDEQLAALKGQQLDPSEAERAVATCQAELQETLDGLKKAQELKRDADEALRSSATKNAGQGGIALVIAGIAVVVAGIATLVLAVIPAVVGALMCAGGAAFAVVGAVTRRGALKCARAAAEQKAHECTGAVAEAQAACDAAKLRLSGAQRTANDQNEKAQRVCDLQEQLDSCEVELAALEQEKARAVDAVLVDQKVSFAGADELYAEAARIEAKAAVAREAQTKLAQESSKALAPYGFDGTLEPAALQEALRQEGAPGQHELRRQIDEVQLGVTEFLHAVEQVLALFGIEGGGDLPVAVERMAHALRACREQEALAAQRNNECSELQCAIAQMQDELDQWVQPMGMQDWHALDDDVFDAMANDADALKRLEWERQELQTKARKAHASGDELRAKAAPAFARYGVPQEGGASAFEALQGRVARRAQLVQEEALAQKNLDEWDAQNQEALAKARQQSTNPDGRTPVQRAALFQKQRDALLSDRAQLEERRKGCLNGLEDYLEIGQGIRQLSQEKQDATAKLFTVQKTAELLQKARTNLDGRYLGGLTDRFNDYANAWLQSEGLSGSVDADFNVKVVGTAGEAHDAESYSMGYRDLLDICFRMALIDTIFEDEKPFIILDDPFVNLDQEKLARALLLLVALSKSAQIVYFTCHPSRVEGQEAQPAASFMLPAQRAPRESNRARMEREQNERAQAQAELVASYHVVPLVQGRAGIRVVSPGSPISTNLFTVAFEMDPDAGRRNNAFELHFIDAKGRALCERQTVEVVDGHVVPERVRFSLTTYADSGSSYDLIIHEDGKEPAELAACISYPAHIAFTTEDFGF